VEDEKRAETEALREEALRVGEAILWGN
jgi:hypothetical protein